RGTTVAAWPAQPAGAVVAVAPDAATTAAIVFPADPVVVRHYAERGDAGANAMVADAAAAARGGAGDPGCGRADPQSGDRRRAVERAAGAVGRRRLECGGELGRAHQDRRRADRES